MYAMNRDLYVFINDAINKISQSVYNRKRKRNRQA
jgi:hypothetical protein